MKELREVNGELREDMKQWEKTPIQDMCTYLKHTTKIKHGTASFLIFNIHAYSTSSEWFVGLSVKVLGLGCFMSSLKVDCKV